MSTATETLPAVAMAKMITDMGRDRLLKTLSFVPDDKLDWAPAPTCKSALHIAAHCGVSNNFFVGIITRTPLPEGVPFPELMAEGKRLEAAVTTREEAVALIEQSTAAIHAALDGLTPSDVESMVETPIFTAPMAFFMNLPGRHMDNHASQIDFLQTCWGDMDWHM